MIVPKKIFGMKVLEHCVDRMQQRRIKVKDIEEVLSKREHIENKKWKDVRQISAKIDRGYVTVMTNTAEKKLLTCWVN